MAKKVTKTESFHVRVDPAAKRAISVAASRQRMDPSSWIRWVSERVALGYAELREVRR